MEILSGNAETEARKYLQAAAEEARQSTCGRAHCGSVIVQSGEIIGRGFNGPPGGAEENRKCDIKGELSENFKSDRTGCVHAEQRAVMDALRLSSDSGEALSGSRLYFVRVDADGEVTRAGRPYCTICSKMALDAGVAEFVLWHDDGITVYNTREYNDLSFQY